MDQRLQRILALAEAGPEMKRRAASGLLTETRDAGPMGSGLFALEDVQPGTLLVIDRPVMMFHPETYTEKDVIAAKESLPTDQRTKYESLYVERSWLDMYSLEVARYMTNAFQLDQDLVGIALAISSLNHSCTPNAATYNDKDRMMLHATKMIKRGEEITVAYKLFPGLTRDKRRERLKEDSGFTCECHTCLNFKESDKRRTEIEKQQRPIPIWDTENIIAGRLKRCVEMMKEEFGEYGVSDHVYKEFVEKHESLGDLDASYNFALDRLEMNAICSGVDSDCFLESRQQMERIAERSAGAKEVMKEFNKVNV